MSAVIQRSRGLRAAQATAAQLELDCGAEKAAVTELAKARNAAVHAGEPVNAKSTGDGLMIARTMVTTLLGRAAPPGRLAGYFPRTIARRRSTLTQAVNITLHPDRK
ncbi:MAG: hypothetical protein ACLQMH_07875 [Solirubrobacteraceae bacterium]